MDAIHELQALRAWKARLDTRIAELEALAAAQQRQALRQAQEPQEQDEDYMRPALSDAGFQQFLLRRQLEGGR